MGKNIEKTRPKKTHMSQGCTTGLHLVEQIKMAKVELAKVEFSRREEEEGQKTKMPYG